MVSPSARPGKHLLEPSIRGGDYRGTRIDSDSRVGRIVLKGASTKAAARLVNFVWHKRRPGFGDHRAKGWFVHQKPELAWQRLLDVKLGGSGCWKTERGKLRARDAAPSERRLPAPATKLDPAVHSKTVGPVEGKRQARRVQKKDDHQGGGSP